MKMYSSWWDCYFSTVCIIIFFIFRYDSAIFFSFAAVFLPIILLLYYVWIALFPERPHPFMLYFSKFCLAAPWITIWRNIQTETKWNNFERNESWVYSGTETSNTLFLIACLVLPCLFVHRWLLEHPRLRISGNASTYSCVAFLKSLTKGSLPLPRIESKRAQVPCSFSTLESKNSYAFKCR